MTPVSPSGARLDKRTMEYVYGSTPFELRVSASLPKWVRDRIAFRHGQKVAWALGVPRFLRESE